MQGLLEDTLTHFSDNMEDSVEQNLHLWAQVQGFQNACLYSGLNPSFGPESSAHEFKSQELGFRPIKVDKHGPNSHHLMLWMWMWLESLYMTFGLENLLFSWIHIWKLKKLTIEENAYYFFCSFIFEQISILIDILKKTWCQQRGTNWIYECEQLNLSLSVQELHERTQKRINLSWCHLWNGLAELISLLTKCNGQSLIQKNKRGEGVLLNSMDCPNWSHFSTLRPLLFSPFVFHYYFLHLTKKM
jgi:hypothetical protein